MKVAALVPAYNEEQSIRDTIRNLRGMENLDEVIVVNDGSKDRTAEIASEEVGIKFVNLAHNRGKGGAIKAGISSTDAEVILLIDADLIGLHQRHIAALLAPVLDGRAKTTMGVFTEGRAVTDLAQKVAPMLSGQRAILREILDQVDIEDTRYGVEVAINKFLEDNDIPIYEVGLDNVSQRTKEEKMGFWKGAKARARMYYDVVKIMIGRDAGKQ